MTGSPPTHPGTPWHDPAVSTEHRPWVDQRFDSAVVGAGLSGLTTALLLARAGQHVVLLEGSSRLGSGTSGRSTAKVSLLQGDRWSRISQRHGEDVLADYITANHEGQAWLARFCDDHDVPRQAHPAFTYVSAPAATGLVEHEHAIGRRHGYDVRLGTPDVPFPAALAVRLDHQFHVDPGRLLEALAEQARAHGVVVVTDARVTEVAGRSPVRLRTSAGAVTAEHVVLATNPPILDRGGFFGGAVAHHSHAIACRTPEPVIDGMYLSLDRPTRSLRDAQDGSLLVVGGNGHITGRGGDTRRRVEDLYDWTHTYFPDAEPVCHWSARDFTPTSELPWAGALLPGREEVLVLGGYAKWGLTNSVAASLALSSRILRARDAVDPGTTPRWSGIYDPWHPRRVRGLPEAALTSVGIVRAAAGGWWRVATREPRAVLSRRCSHLGGPLCWNEADGTWDCPLHGSRFDASGDVVEGPATRRLAAAPPHGSD